ncbi:CPBP family intramembrane glutamic endopeptidase [Nonomuraea aridisoli]|uniref:CPBP family intramembrane glutamic endopeptidase n=1 Tax=Nonomuraea aridisoli TaxID=2070368 RepID=UPI001F371A96|nr:CPBP family intramembrane glutamic endopeptidase [Nonomuraea aridisoli]
MRNNALPRTTLIGGLLLIAGSAVWLVLNDATGIRHSADHDGTVPMWHRWVPVAAGLLVARLVPATTPPEAHEPPGRALRVQAGVMLAAGVLFAVTLRLVGGGEPAHTALKLLLLLAVPLVLFRVTRGVRLGAPDAAAWRRYGPVAPVAVWLSLSYAGPTAVPPGSSWAGTSLACALAAVVVVFAVNALLEEVFYRRWLQTRWERILGRWPAVVLVSLLFGAWHVGIMGTGDLTRDLASVFVNQAVQGLFLGYLWSKYRMMWPILVVHGMINVGPSLVRLL